MAQRRLTNRTNQRTDKKQPKATPAPSINKGRKGPQPAPELPPLDNSTKGIIERMRRASDAGNPNAQYRKSIGRRSKLSDLFEGGQDSTYAQILEYVRLGASDAAASAAFGIDPVTFCRWLRHGRERQGSPLYRQLYLDISLARGQCRALAEMSVKAKDELAWLKAFGGRSKPGLDGWTETVNVGGDPNGEPVNINHNHKGEIDHNHTHQHAHAHLVINPKVSDGQTLIAEALTYAEEAGLLQRTEAGAKMFLQPTDSASSSAPTAEESIEVAAKKIEALTKPPKNGNGKH